MTWTDGWPVVGEVAPVMTAPPWAAHPVPLPVLDDFDNDGLHPRWISVRSRPAESWSLTEHPGWLTLRARGASMDATAGRGGLAVRLDERHHYEIEAGDGEVRVVARIGTVLSTVATRSVTAGPVRLRLDVIAPSPGDWHPSKEPDLLQFGIEEADGAVDVLTTLDGRYLSTEVAGGFTGRVIGMYAAAGSVRFDWFDYEPRGDDARTPGSESGP
ncbi:hypothetical protein [Micromonospora sp. KC207]|uniref:beta-xylosidase family glycoside hydrolase n=1 Tax=Micromonospora sp. KC207 TaxID=2530377 RepID=UPI001FB609F8|nr:hypothetical protein [Micromonospora sp. KC207]